MTAGRAPARDWRSHRETSAVDLKGAEKLRVELKRLKSEDRPRVIQAIAEARAHGDLSENAEYHAARAAELHRRSHQGHRGAPVELGDHRRRVAAGHG